MKTLLTVACGKTAREAISHMTADVNAHPAVRMNFSARDFNIIPYTVKTGWFSSETTWIVYCYFDELPSDPCIKQESK